ncbi:MAG: DUF255 domain-containing protein [Phycisphaerales bacterium]|nr:DUF255 domain-containing protein [Phycisphaerales bacterium]
MMIGLATMFAGCDGGDSSGDVAAAPPSPAAAATARAGDVELAVKRSQSTPETKTMEPQPDAGVQGHGRERKGEPNRLAKETSPYLLQHAYNPVEWYSWGPEAFEAARARNVPIFLSIGYSTCYWCHVMERESFENPEVGALMSRDFVCIKVDREQRPDVDELYMTACQVFTRLTTGQASGGWPLSVFLEPKSLKPFYVGTYFPPQPGYGKPSFTQLLEGMSDAWNTQRGQVEAQAEQVASLVARELEVQPGVEPLDIGLAARATSSLQRFHDPENGGFGGEPKFPQPVYLEVMIDEGWDRPEIREAVVRSLDGMAIGGVYDHVGGGFHRYAVDAEWTVPHFEKMLYDNGQLASLYADAHARTGDVYYAEVVRGILDYVLREMTAADGAFLSAQDAEVDAKEGGSYIWRPDDFREALAQGGRGEDIDFAMDVYGLARGPNFQDPHHRDEPPANVLRLRARPGRLATEMGMERSEFIERLQKVNEALLAVRDTRKQPLTDDKIIAAWNGLMIAGMADGGRVLEEPRYVKAAEQAADAVLARLGQGDGGLYRTSREGKAQIDAFLEDYAMLADGLLSIHDATGDPLRLQQAQELVEAARERFWNDQRGGWYDTQADQPDLFIRSTNLGDGAVPSGSSTMLLVLLDMYERTGDSTFLEDARAAFEGMSVALARNPVGMSRGTRAILKAAELQPDVLPGTRRSAPPATPVRPALLKTDDPNRWVVRLTIDPSMHVNAHEPGDDDLIGLSLDAVSGGTIRVAWPEGTRYRDDIMIHRGMVDLPVILERSAPDSTVVVRVGWQACTDSECLRPEQAELRIPSP